MINPRDVMLYEVKALHMVYLLVYMLDVGAMGLHMTVLRIGWS